MNTARLGNLWAAAEGDTHKMAEALGDELANKETGYVTVDRLEAGLSKLRSDLTRTMVLVQIGGSLAVIISIWLKG